MNRFNRAARIGTGEGPAAVPSASVGEQGDGMTLAMAYVPSQPFGDLYSAEEGLSRGTLFAALDKPFVGGCLR